VDAEFVLLIRLRCAQPPSPLEKAIFMSASPLGWGKANIYTIHGRGGLSAPAKNFQN